MPFNVACGFCENCERGLTGACLTVNPGTAGGAYGFADMGPYSGGQAEFLGVPSADFNCLQLPPDVKDKASSILEQLTAAGPNKNRSCIQALVSSGHSLARNGSKRL